MVMEVFDIVVKELGALLGCELKVDENHFCRIKLNEIEVQLEMDRSGENLMLITGLEGLPSGKNLENLLKAALRENGNPPPLYGSFGYNGKKQKLILFSKLNMQELNGEKLYNHILPFTSKAKVWKDAIQRGDLPQSDASHSGGSSGLFGMIR